MPLAAIKVTASAYYAVLATSVNTRRLFPIPNFVKSDIEKDTIPFL